MARDEQIDETDDMEDSEVETDGVELEADADSDDDSGPAPVSARSEDSPEARTVASRDRVRQQLSADIEAFLARGGQISQIEPNVVSDPPRKPDGDYGSRPL